MLSSISNYTCYLKRFYASLLCIVFFCGTVLPSVIKTEKRSTRSPGEGDVPMRFTAINDINVVTELISYNEHTWL